MHGEESECVNSTFKCFKKFWPLTGPTPTTPLKIILLQMKVMNFLKIYARNTSSFASIRPFGLVYIVFNWDHPLWRPLAHINDTNLYMNFENSGCTCPLGGALPTAVWIPVYHICKAVFKLNMLLPFASFCLSVTKIPQPLRIKPICHYAYLLIIFDISDLSDL